MVKYVGSFVFGALVGFTILASSSCVDKKAAVEAVDAGPVVPVVEGTMKVVAAPTPVSPQVTDAVTQSVSPVVDGGVAMNERHVGHQRNKR